MQRRDGGRSRRLGQRGRGEDLLDFHQFGGRHADAGTGGGDHPAAQARDWAVNPKRIYRLYNELRLQLRNKISYHRVKAKLREDRTPATRSKETCAMDFVHDQLAAGRKIRVLTVVDTFSRFSPVVDPRFSYKGEDVVATLDRICRSTGYPESIRVGLGSEFISRDLDLWAYANGVVLDFSRPGRPTDTDVVGKPFQAGAGIFFSEWDLARGLVRHRAVKSAYASSAFSTRIRSAARFSGML